MKKQKGQTLLEILLAFGVAVLTLSAITIAVISSLNNAQFTKNQNLANHYAQEGMEVIRKIRDSSLANLASYKKATEYAYYCLPADTIELSPALVSDSATNCGGPNVGGIFVRKVILEHNFLDCSALNPTPGPTPPLISKGSRIRITVAWSDGKCPSGNIFCHKVELISCFSTIDLRSAP